MLTDLSVYESMIGFKVSKKHGRNQPKPFKSGLKINTVRGVVIHDILGVPAFIFEEDDSYVECRRCKIV
jgi:hypothetical protein